MERTVVLAIALVFALSVMGLTGNCIATTKAKSKEITGKIVSVDTVKNLLTMKTKKGEMTFNVNEKTQIMMGKEQRHLSDLKAGEKVKVYYTHVEGKDLAERIIVKAVTKK